MQTPTRFDELKARLAAIGQDHVFRFWSDLNEGHRQQLLADLALINLDELPGLSRLAAAGDAHHTIPNDLEAAPVARREEIGADAVKRGRALLAAGKVAAFTVAGGQGTRLGFTGPKGCFPISPVRGKTLFQLFAESIVATGRRYGAPVRWYIMTSPANHAETTSFFANHAFFGLPPEDVVFFQQGVMPAFDRSGKILLEQPHRIALSPDGHGGSLRALAESGALADMKRRCVEHLSYFQVDNPLVHCLDPVFVGLHDLRGSEMTSKSVPKVDDLERVGNFAVRGGQVHVIEYSDFPEQLARLKNADGTRKFDAANIAVHVLSRRFIERLTADRAAFALPWHRALKKVPFIDLENGRRVEPAEPNAVKLEAFVFDALPLAANAVVMETSRAEEFSPVKNPSGVDSVETAKRDMSRRAARWIMAAGHSIPRRPDGSPDGTFEVSPLLALDESELAGKHVAIGSLPAGSTHYFE